MLYQSDLQSPIAGSSLDRSMNGFSTSGLRDLMTGRLKAERERQTEYEDDEEHYEQ